MTLRYDMESKIVDFLLTAPRLYMFRFKIELSENGAGFSYITFEQLFTSISEKGNAFSSVMRARISGKD